MYSNCTVCLVSQDRRDWNVCRCRVPVMTVWPGNLCGDFAVMAMTHRRMISAQACIQALRVKLSYASAVMLWKCRVAHAYLTLLSTRLPWQQLAHRVGFEHRLSCVMKQSTVASQWLLTSCDGGVCRWWGLSRCVAMAWWRDWSSVMMATLWAEMVALPPARSHCLAPLQQLV